MVSKNKTKQNKNISIYYLTVSESQNPVSPLLRVSKGLNQGHGRIRLVYVSSRDGFTANLTQMCAKSLQLYLTLLAPWTVACQAPLPMELSRQDHWSTVSFLFQGIFLTQGLNPSLLRFLHCQMNSLPPEPPGKPSNLTQIVGQIQFFVNIRMKSSCPCWLSAEGLFSPMSCLHCFSCTACDHLQQWWVEFLLCFRSLHLLSVASPSLQLEEALCF